MRWAKALASILFDILLTSEENKAQGMDRAS